MSKTTTIGNAFKIKSGEMLSSKNMNNGIYPVFGGNGISGYHDEFMFDEPKIVIGRVGAYCGNIHLTKPKSWITDNALYIDEKQQEYADDYLIHLLRSLNLNKYASQSGQPLISLGRIKDIPIPLPPLPIQQKIAAILDAADAYRQKTKALIEKYDLLAQSLFLEMFGDPMRNEKGWEMKKLGELSNRMKYGTNTKSYEYQTKSDIAIIRIPNIQAGYIDFSDLKYSQLSQKEFNDTKLQNGDLLFVRSNGNPEYIGRCACFNSDKINASYASYLIRVRLNDIKYVSPLFLSFLFNYKSYRNRVLREARTTAGNYNLNTQSLKGFEIIIPPVPLQTLFADRIALIDQQKQQAQQSFEKAEALFNSLLQRAFKGELVS